MSPDESNARLDNAIAALKAAASAETPPASVDAAIGAAIARARKRRRVGAVWPAWIWMLAPGAVAAVIVLVAVAQHATPDGGTSAPQPVSSSTEPATAQTATQFMPVVPLEELERTGNALIVPARLPRMTLAELGFPVNPARAADAIDAELLVRRDGTLLAVRFTY